MQGNRLITIGAPRIKAILAYFDALPVDEQATYLGRIRATLQVLPTASDADMVAYLREFADASE